MTTMRTKRDIREGKATGQPGQGQRESCANGCISVTAPVRPVGSGEMSRVVVIVVIASVGSVSDTGEGGARG